MKNFTGRIAPAILFAFLATFVFAATGYAQDLDDVTVSGRVVDSNDAPIVGASVTATLVTTNVERTVATDEDGRYRIVELQPGLYKIRASQTSFGTKETTDLGHDCRAKRPTRFHARARRCPRRANRYH